nr:hypothetical protein [Tanacetum cinerariifolium]
MELCTKLQQRVLDLETTKTSQALETDNLKRRVKKLERRRRLRTHGLKRIYMVGLSTRIDSSEDEGLGEEDASKQERISDIDADERITLVSTHDDADTDLHGEEVFVAQQDKNAVEKEELAELKHTKAKAKAKGIIFHEQEESTTTTTAVIPKPRSQDKGKAKIIEEPIKLKKKDQIQLDEEVALKLQAELQAELEEEQRLKRRKFFAAKREEEKKNKPPTQAQQRKIMCTYLKNIEGKKLRDLKNKSFDSIQKMVDRAFKRVNIFVDYRTELVEDSSKKAKAEVKEGSSKRAEEELEQENAKNQKIDYDKDTAELKQLVKIIPDEEGVAIDAIPLAVKSPSIKLVKDKYGSTRLEEDYDRVLSGDLKVMFEPHIKDEVWKMQQRYNVVKWTLFNSYGVHYLSLQSGHIYMLVEKRYPLTPVTITDMLNKKLHADYFDEMTYQLLKLVLK